MVCHLTYCHKTSKLKNMKVPTISNGRLQFLVKDKLYREHAVLSEKMEFLDEVMYMIYTIHYFHLNQIWMVR